MKRSTFRIACLAALAVAPAACGQVAPQTPAPVFAPAASAAAARPSGSRSNLFPRTAANVHLEMVFNYNVTNPAVEAGVVDMVWGSNWATKPPGVYNTAYIPYSVDNGTYPLKWYAANHPDWIEYRCDRKTPAYEFGADNAPLDFNDPAVQAFQWSEWTDPQLAAGYSGIDVDTMSLTNDWKQCGHFDASGSWVQDFSGRTDDPAFRRAILAWEADTYAHVHAQTPTATMQVNYSYEFGVSPNDNLTLMTTTDLLFDERGFTNWGIENNVAGASEWRGIVKALHYVQSKGGCYMTNGEEPGPSSAISPAERQWVVANYLLVKNDCTYVWMSGFNGKQQDYGRFIMFPEYSVKVGRPMGAMAERQGAYVRSFTNGLAIVNPNAKPATVTLPSGTYYTVSGSLQSSPVTMAPSTGLVLVK